MFTIDCPNCNNQQEVDGEDLPKFASHDFFVTCDHCDNVFLAGWFAELEHR